jgi:hypothetical protein
MEPVNDPQLSKLLREWHVEDAPPSLDLHVLGICKPPRRFPIARRKSLWAAAVAGVAFLIVLTQAMPQTLNLISPPPYIVDSEYFRFADDGSRAVEMFSTSYVDQHGNEVLLGRTIAAHPFETALGRSLDALLPLMHRSSSPVKRPHNTVGLISGCSYLTCLALDHWYFAKAESGPDAPCAGGSVVSFETIVGHPTVATMRPLPNPRTTASHPIPARITTWMAPDLGCFALRLLIEEQQPDGTFHPVSEKQALRVTVKP